MTEIIISKTKSKTKAFKEQHFKILRCLLLTDKPLTIYEVAENEKGFNNRQRSGEIVPYFGELLNFGFIIKETIEEKEKYKINYKAKLIDYLVRASKFKKDSRAFLVWILEEYFSAFRLNEKGELGIDRNFNLLILNQEAKKKYEDRDIKEFTPEEIIEFLKINNDLPKDDDILII